MSFRRAGASREPFWATLPRNGSRFRVYFMNDRGGIYALGYPVDHVVRPPRQPRRADGRWSSRSTSLLLGGADVFSARSRRRTPASGRALLRELRSSFYRKLFLAFVAGAVVPVVHPGVSACATYFAQSGRAERRRRRGETATVAQRLVEDYASLQQRGASDARRARRSGHGAGRAARSIRTSTCSTARGCRRRASATCSRPGCLSMRTPSRRIARSIARSAADFVGVEQVGGRSVPARRGAASTPATARASSPCR